MRQKAERHQDAAERTIKDIRRQTRKRYSSEEKIRIVLAGLRGEDIIAESREPQQPHARRCHLRTRPNHLDGKRKDQTKDIRQKALATPQIRRLTSTTR